jgi:sodium transport system permease protein
MNWKNVKLIFLREVRDQVRDRRTLFMVAVLPLLLYPVLGIAMVQMMTTFNEQTRTVVLLGAADLPDPPLIEGDRFISDYFDDPADAEKLRVVTEGALADGQDPDVGQFVREAVEYRPRIEELARVTRALRDARDAKDETRVAELGQKETALKAEIGDWFNRSPAQVLIVIPTGYRERLEELNARLAERNALDSLPSGPDPVILENRAVDKSAIALRRVREALRNWEDKLLELRLAQAQLPASLHTPFDATDVDLGQDDQIAASLWSKLFPTLLVVMAITGAFYPAIDVGAGEKERGTMETLLICPATRTEIVTGKFLTVMGFSLTTALLNLMSMGFTGKYMLEMAGTPRLSQLGNVSFPPVSALVWLVLLAVPLAALFSALSLAFAMFARSSKEGQYYLTPLLMVTIGLTVLCLNPAIDITPYYSVLPVMGPALLLKALLLGATSPINLSGYFAPVLLSSCAYSALALWWAIELFKRESILFREAERLDLRLWLRHVLRDKEPTPSFTEAGFCFVLILVLQFLSYSAIRNQYLQTSVADQPVMLLKLQMVYLLVTVATPALMMAAVLTTDFRKTLKLAWPSLSMLGVSLVLPVVLLPLSQELVRSLEGWFFPELPEGAAALFQTMSDPSMSLVLPLLAFAVAPAVCEELAFRGFILSGMQRSGRPWLPIVMSSVTFGVVHMISQQVFNAMLLGLVLGLLAVRSRSLLPCIVFHFLFNGSQVLLARVDPDVFADPVWEPYCRVERVGDQTALHFHWPVLLVCGIVACVLLRWLVRHGRRDAAGPLIPRPVLDNDEISQRAVHAG